MQYDEMFVRQLTKKAQFKAGSVMDLSAAIGASEKSIYKWMNGTSMPKAEYLLKMLDMMGYLVTPPCNGKPYTNGFSVIH